MYNTKDMCVSVANAAETKAKNKSPTLHSNVGIRVVNAHQASGLRAAAASAAA